MTNAHEEKETRLMTQLATTTPTTNGEAPLPRRAGTRALLPSAWLNRTLHLEYVGASSEAQETTATLLDWCPIGLLLNIAGAKTLLPRERLVLCELAENVRKRSRIARHGRGSSTPPGTSERRPKGRASSLAGLCYTNTPSPPS